MKNNLITYKCMLGGGGFLCELPQKSKKKERWQLFSNSTSNERRAGLNKKLAFPTRGGSL